MHRYREARERAGLTVPQATALLLGTDLPSILHSIEESAVTPTSEQRARLAALYGVTECWLQGHDIEIDHEITTVIRASGLSFDDAEHIVALLATKTTCTACHAGGQS